jgi:hypothetical protein
MCASATPASLPTALAEYADRLLIGTGLTALDAILIATRASTPQSGLAAIADALRAGWELAEYSG